MRVVFRLALICCSIFIISILTFKADGYLQAAEPQEASSVVSSATEYRTLLNRYCIACHNQRLKTAGLVLDARTVDISNLSSSPDVWEKVAQKLRMRAMPPAGRPRPDAASYDSLATYLEDNLDDLAEHNPNPGRSVLRRLNRFEYINAIRDLLSVDVTEDSLLPIDEVRFGFDNISSALSVTPVLLERYMSAARKISVLAVGDSEIRPSSQTYPVDLFLVQEERMSEDLPFGSRGGIAIRHYFPVDGEYVVKATLQRNSRGYVRGLFESHQLDFRLDGARIELITIGGGLHMAIPGPPFSQANSLGDEESDVYQLTEVDANLEARFLAQAGSRVIGVTFLNQNLIPEGPLRSRMTEVDKVPFVFQA
jgi:hypothetical protein